MSEFRLSLADLQRAFNRMHEEWAMAIKLIKLKESRVGKNGNNDDQERIDFEMWKLEQEMTKREIEEAQRREREGEDD